MATYPTGSAFPWVTLDGNPVSGLTKREYFAAMTLQGILANSRLADGSLSIEEKAAFALDYADAIIAELNKIQK